MIKFLVFFVLGAASVYFLIRAFVKSDPGKLSRVIKTVIIIAVVFGVLFLLSRGNLGVLANTPRLPLLKRNNTPNTTAMIITVLITLDNFPGSLFTKALIKK